MIEQASKRTNQGGSILTFIIVAVILGLALIGSVMFIRHKGEAAQSQTPIFGPVTENKTNDDKSGDKNTDTGSSSQPGEESAPSTTNNGTDSSTGTTSESQASAPVSELPKTGPVDTLGAALIVGLVAMVVVSYVRSRHLSWQL